MISVDEAQVRILSGIEPVLGREVVPVGDSIGMILSGDIVAIEPNPRFTNSALDGYAVFCAGDAAKGTTLQVTGEVAAGDAQREAAKGETLRVFTGAPIPASTYAVAYQEETSREGDTVTLTKELSEGQGVRKAGSDFVCGDLILEKGHKVNSGSLAVLASQGITEIGAFARPKVRVIVTGDELSTRPNASQIYDSNSPMLKAQVESLGCVSDCKTIGDQFDTTRNLIRETAGTFDAIVVSGGASVGDYDYLAHAISDIGEVVIHGVSIKPGKPFLFAKINGKPLFGLPGNPASVFVVFELFVRPALAKLCGSSRTQHRTLVQLRFDIITKNREEWLRCQFIGDGEVEPVAEQGSFGLRSLAAAEALVRIPANTHHKSGELRQALLMQNAIKPS